MKGFRDRRGVEFEKTSERLQSGALFEDNAAFTSRSRRDRSRCREDGPARPKRKRSKTNCFLLFCVSFFRFFWHLGVRVWTPPFNRFFYWPAAFVFIALRLLTAALPPEIAPNAILRNSPFYWFHRPWKKKKSIENHGFPFFVKLILLIFSRLRRAINMETNVLGGARLGRATFISKFSRLRRAAYMEITAWGAARVSVARCNFSIQKQILGFLIFGRKTAPPFYWAASARIGLSPPPLRAYAVKHQKTVTFKKPIQNILCKSF